MAMDAFAAVATASFLACAVTTIGIWMISRYQEWGTKHSVYFISFAAGVLISVSFVHIIPESLEMHEMAPAFLLVGFLAIYLSNRLLDLYVCHGLQSADRTASIAPVLAIGFHSFVDGVIYSVTFKVSLFTGALAAVGMVLHEFPEGIVTFLLLERSGFSRKSRLWARLWLRPYPPHWGPWCHTPSSRTSRGPSSAYCWPPRPAH